MAKTEKATAEKTEDNKTPSEGASQSDSKKQVSAQQVEFAEAAPHQAGGAETTGTGGKLDIILDMNVPITATIGQTQIPVRRLLQLGPGSVLKLDKSIEAPADLFLKDAKFAAGDVVVVDGRFAVRIKQIIGADNPGVAAKQQKTDDK
jgi:flagellar motor switch protein FliN/FliY